MVMLPSLTGCDGDDRVRSYRAPKESPLPVRAGPLMTTTGAQNRITWDPPAHWRIRPGAEEAMRFATFEIGPEDNRIELTVTPLGPAAGDVLANINRWREQLGLAKIAAEQLDQVTRIIDTADKGAKIILVDLVQKTEQATRMLAAIVHRPDRVWFFKAVGPADVLDSEKAAFDTFMQSVSFVQTSAPTAQHPLHHHNISFDTPQGWQPHEQAQLKAPRVAAFTITDGDHAALVTVTRFPGDQVGSALDNINRWRRQVGLDPVNDMQRQTTATITCKSTQGVLLDLLGPPPPDTPTPAKQKHMFLVIFAIHDEVWFLKMLGPHELMQNQKQTFVSFAQSVALADDE